MLRLTVVLAFLLSSSAVFTTFTAEKINREALANGDLKDLYFGEALFYAHQGDTLTRFLASTLSWPNIMDWMNPISTLSTTTSAMLNFPWVISNFTIVCIIAQGVQ